MDHVQARKAGLTRLNAEVRLFHRHEVAGIAILVSDFPEFPVSDERLPLTAAVAFNSRPEG
jgi:hypothetical protein